MKRLVYLLIMAILLTTIPEMVSAQSNDPFEQQVLQSKGGKNEKRNKNRRKVETEEVAPVPTPTPTPAPQPQQEDEKRPVNEMTISNPCSDWLDFELVSIVGSKGSQKVEINFRFTNHDKNKYIYVGGNFIAYDTEGEEHKRYSSVDSYNAITDVTIKSKIEIPGKINPNKTTVMPVIVFSVGDCRIEIRNAKIDWK